MGTPRGGSVGGSSSQSTNWVPDEGTVRTLLPTPRLHAPDSAVDEAEASADPKAAIIELIMVEEALLAMP